MILFKAGSGTGSDAGGLVVWIGEMTVRLDPSPFAEIVVWLEWWLVRMEGLLSALELRRLSSCSCCSSGLDIIEALRFRPDSSVGVVLAGMGAICAGGRGATGVDAKERPRSF